MDTEQEMTDGSVCRSQDLVGTWQGTLTEPGVGAGAEVVFPKEAAYTLRSPGGVTFPGEEGEKRQAESIQVERTRCARVPSGSRQCVSTKAKASVSEGRKVR